MTLQHMFNQQFLPLKETLLDDEGMFSGSKMYAELTALEPLAKQIGANSPELLELYNALSMLQKKRGEIDDQVNYSKAAINIQQVIQQLPLHDYILLLNRALEGLQEQEEWADALNYSEMMINLIDQDEQLSISQQLYLKQDYGFLLHETGNFEAALEANLQTLTLAEKKLGTDLEECIGLLTNIAQNYYELDQFKNAEIFLKRSLQLARQHTNHDKQFDILFQLGVLAHEAGNPDQTRVHFMEYRQLAETLNDDYYLEKAEELLQELEERLRE